MNNVKVSVVIPVYNCAEFLPQCIESLRAQTLDDIEMIFVCDASPDNSLSILRTYEAKDSRIRIVREDFPNTGAAANLGLELARGRYVLALKGTETAARDLLMSLVVCLARRGDQSLKNNQALRHCDPEPDCLL